MWSSEGIEIEIETVTSDLVNAVSECKIQHQKPIHSLFIEHWKLLTNKRFLLRNLFTFSFLTVA